jgi:hypothetical protein
MEEIMVVTASARIDLACCPLDPTLPPNRPQGGDLIARSLREKRFRRAGRSIASLLLLSSALLRAEPPANAPPATSLPLEPTVTVDLRTQQQQEEKAAALRRAEAVAAARGAKGAVKSIPEIDLIAREVLNDLAAMPVRIDGTEAAWRVRSSTPPDLFAQRLIARLLRAGFSTTTRCAGDEWSGMHGASRVTLQVDARAVSVLLTAVSLPCPPPGAAR